MVTPPSDYFSALSLSRNLCVGRLPVDTGCPDSLAMFHVYSLPEIPKSSCSPWSLCPFYLPSHNYTCLLARTHLWHTQEQKITWRFLLVCISYKLWLTALKLKRKESSRVRKMSWIKKKPQKQQTNKKTSNKPCSTPQKAGVHLSRTSSKKLFNQVLYLLPLRHSCLGYFSFNASQAKSVLSYLYCRWNLNYAEKLLFYFSVLK